jgi:hypothetical protein
MTSLVVNPAAVGETARVMFLLTPIGLVLVNVLVLREVRRARQRHQRG